MVLPPRSGSVPDGQLDLRPGPVLGSFDHRSCHCRLRLRRRLRWLRGDNRSECSDGETTNLHKPDWINVRIWRRFFFKLALVPPDIDFLILLVSSIVNHFHILLLAFVDYNRITLCFSPLIPFISNFSIVNFLLFTRDFNITPSSYDFHFNPFDRSGIGSVCGPILGGVFTSRASWRWCFYINLPVGGVVLATVLLFFHPSKQAETTTQPFWKRVLDLDPPGNGILITAVAMLLLALQWGGTKYAWNSYHISGLLLGAGVEALVFGAWLKHRGRRALVPLQIIGQRTVAASLVSSFFGASVLFIHTYYLPYWFQAIRNDSPIQSGIHLIPYVGSIFFFSVVAGIVVSKTGYFNPPALLGPVLASIGCGLLTTLRVDSSTAKWVGFEIIASAGTGLMMQQGLVAVQAVLAPKKTAIGIALIFFAQNLAGSIFVSVGSSLLRNQLSAGLSAAQLPGVDVQEMLSVGATAVRERVPGGELARFLVIYNLSLRKIFIMSIPLAASGLIAALPMEWRNLKKPNNETVSTEVV